jgi:flagellar assembly protein FliH
MLSDSKPPAHAVAVHTPAYVYPAPAVPATGGRPSAPNASPSILERLYSPEAQGYGAPEVTEEQIKAREARARGEGRNEGLAQCRADFEQKLAAEKQSVVQMARDFLRDRETYFQRVEAEVVGLALAIARKILHREAQVDPLLLAGVVRVGLDNVGAGTRVRLRVHPNQVLAWQEFFAQQADLQHLPELMGDPTLGVGHCMLETELAQLPHLVE